MPVELLRRAAPADESVPLLAPAPPPAADDDWSGVFCCSAMRPRESAEYRVMSAESNADEADWLEG